MPKLGLGNASSSGSSMITPGVVTDGLVMKHMYPAGAVQPLSDGAAYFDGDDTSGSYIDCAASNNFITGTNVTYSCWVNVSDADQARLITAQKGPGSTNLSLGVNNNNGAEVKGYITFIVWNGSSSHNYVNYSAGINDNNWHHIAATTTSSAQNLYLDGALVASGSNTFGNAASSNRFTLGSFHNSGEFLGGYMANVGVWSRVLTQAEIKSIMWKQYADLSTSEKTSLVSFWNLDALTEFDSVGTDNGLVLDNHDTTVGSELLTGFTNGSSYPFNIFTSSGREISAAIETSGNWGGCASNAISVTAGEWYKCTFDLTYISGTDNLQVVIGNGPSGASSERSNDTFTSTNGANTVYLKITDTDNAAYLQIGTGAETDVINFSMSNISLKKMNGNHGELK